MALFGHGGVGDDRNVAARLVENARRLPGFVLQFDLARLTKRRSHRKRDIRANQLVHDQRAVGHVLQRKFYAEFFRDTNGGQDVVRLMRVRL